MSRVAWLEEWLDAEQVPWTFRDAAPLPQFDIFESLANQARVIPLDEETVESYAADMERGDVFPAVVARPGAGDMLVLVGGNHRVAGALRAGRGTHPVYVIDCDDDKVLRRLAIEDNRRHGLPLSTEDRLWHAADLVRSGDHTQSEAAKICGLSAAMLGRHLSSGEAGRRAIRLGVDGWQNVSASTKARLASIDDDKVFAAALRLCASGAVKSSDVAALVANLNTADTDDALIRIAEIAGSAKTTVRKKQGRPPAARNMPRVRFLMDLEPLVRHDTAAVVSDCVTVDDRHALRAQVETVMGKMKALLAELDSASHTTAA